jgi:hypothetical protein
MSDLDIGMPYIMAYKDEEEEGVILPPPDEEEAVSEEDELEAFGVDEEEELLEDA